MSQIVIISENTLAAMALRSLLSDIAPAIDVVCYHDIEEFNTAAPVVAHFFVSARVLFENMDMFRPLLRRTIVITEGDNTSFSQAGMRTIDATATEATIVRQLLHIYQAGHPSGHHPAPQHNAETVHGDDASALPTLSQREKEVLALLVKGYINKEIADKLNISLTTAIYHRNNISEKLKTRSLGRLTIYAVLNNIVSLSEI